MLAGFGKTTHNFFDDLRLQFAGGEVVHKKHGRCALHRDVIHTVIHQVRAHRVVDIHFEGDFQFSAYAIHTRNQHRIYIFLIDREQPAEATDLAQHSLGEGFVGQILDALLGAVAAIDADTGIGVGDRVAGSVGVLGHVSVRHYQVGEISGAHRTVGSISGATNSSTSAVASGFFKCDR